MRVRTDTVEGEKARSFEFELVAYVRDDKLVPSVTNTQRPVWALCAMPHAAYAPVRANLMSGRSFSEATNRRSSERYEFLRSAPFVYEPQRHPEGMLLTIYQPELMVCDPGFVDPTGMRALVMPSQVWLDEMTARMEPERAALEAHARRYRAYAGDHGRYLGGYAWLDELTECPGWLPLLAQYLDRRTRVPLIPDNRYMYQLVCRLRVHGALRTAKSYALERVGLSDQPQVLCCGHTDFATLAAEEAQAFLSLTE